MAAVTNEVNQEKPSRRRAVLWLIVLGVVVAVVAISLPFLSILITILLPPMPPIPDGGRVEISRQNYAYGVDEFVYQTTLDPCLAVTFYQEIGATCRVIPYQCDGRAAPEGFQTGNTLLARCEGVVDLAPFSMTWWTLIVRSQKNPSEAQLNVWREMNWLGTRAAIPAPTSE